jgi:hypothetical protein
MELLTLLLRITPVETPFRPVRRCLVQPSVDFKFLGAFDNS